jgi:hypothetical protein
MDREQIREREKAMLMQANRYVFRDIEAKSEHPLSTLDRRIKYQLSLLPQDEKNLMESEAELERFQPTIERMKGKKPSFNYNGNAQSQRYYDYRDYEEEKDRLEGRVTLFKRTLQDRKKLINDLEFQIQNRIQKFKPGQEERDAQMRERFLHDAEDEDTIQSGNIFDKATKKTPLFYDNSRQRSELNPLQKLSNHGQGFRGIFSSVVNAFQGQPDAKKRMGYPTRPTPPGGTRYRKAYTAKILKKRRLTRTCPKPTRYMAD